MDTDLVQAISGVLSILIAALALYLTVVKTNEALESARVAHVQSELREHREMERVRFESLFDQVAGVGDSIADYSAALLPLWPGSAYKMEGEQALEWALKVEVEFRKITNKLDYLEIPLSELKELVDHEPGTRERLFELQLAALWTQAWAMVVYLALANPMFDETLTGQAASDVVFEKAWVEFSVYLEGKEIEPAGPSYFLAQRKDVEEDSQITRSDPENLSPSVVASFAMDKAFGNYLDVAIKFRESWHKDYMGKKLDELNNSMKSVKR